MTPQIIFPLDLALGYVAWLLCFGTSIWPRLREMDSVHAQRAIATLIGSSEARTNDLPKAPCELTDCDAAASASACGDLQAMKSTSRPHASSKASGTYFEFLFARAHSRRRTERTYWSGVSLNSSTARSNEVGTMTIGRGGSGLPQFGLPRRFVIDPLSSIGGDRISSDCATVSTRWSCLKHPASLEREWTNSTEDIAVEWSVEVSSSDFPSGEMSRPALVRKMRIGRTAIVRMCSFSNLETWIWPSVKAWQ